MKSLKILNTYRICVIMNARLNLFVAHGRNAQRVPRRLYCHHKSNKAVEH